MSTNPRIYLDHNATAPLHPAARAAVEAALAVLGNPSSIHGEGRAARDVVERARDKVAQLLVRPREQVVFTSGGTEANALGVQTLARVARRRGLPQIVAASAIDHPSLRGAVAALGWPVVPLDRAAEAGVVAYGLVNHELGTITHLGETEALIHVDVVQAAGRMALSGVRADSLAISGHKLGAPQGVGAVALAVDDAGEELGHQERGRRAGTENVLGIAGFGAAASVVDLAAWPAVAALGDRLEAGLVAMGARIHGADQPRIGGTINAAFAGARGDNLVMALDIAGVAASTGAACTSGSVNPSAVLLALGYPVDQAREAIRFSLGRTTTAKEIEQVLALLPVIVDRARGRR